MSKPTWFLLAFREMYAYQHKEFLLSRGFFFLFFTAMWSFVSVTLWSVFIILGFFPPIPYYRNHHQSTFKFNFYPFVSMCLRYFLFFLFAILCFLGAHVWLTDPEKRKRSPTEGLSSPGSKESPSGRMESARAAGVLLVPRIQLPPPSSGKSSHQFDTRSLNEENFIASIGV